MYKGVISSCAFKSTFPPCDNSDFNTAQFPSLKQQHESSVFTWQNWSSHSCIENWLHTYSYQQASCTADHNAYFLPLKQSITQRNRVACRAMLTLQEWRSLNMSFELCTCLPTGFMQMDTTEQFQQITFARCIWISSKLKQYVDYSQVVRGYCFK